MSKESTLHPICRVLGPGRGSGSRPTLGRWERSSKRRVLAETELDPSTRAVIEAAGRRGIPWFRLSPAGLVQPGQGARRKLIQTALTCGTSAVALGVARDKDISCRLRGQACLPVSRGTVACSEEEALEALEWLAPRGSQAA